jgi:hypothetical protein
VEADSWLSIPERRGPARPLTNLGLIMRLLVGTGTPREFVAGVSAHLTHFTIAANAVVGILIVVAGGQAAMLVISVEPEPHG